MRLVTAAAASPPWHRTGKRLGGGGFRFSGFPDRSNARRIFEPCVPLLGRQLIPVTLEGVGEHAAGEIGAGRVAPANNAEAW